MAGRPKLNGPKKKSLTLTVNEETRERLTLVSELRGMSISAMVEEWAIAEAEKLNVSVVKD